MKRLLFAVLLVGGLAAATSARAASPYDARVFHPVGWNHHHHDDCFRGDVRFYQPVVRYYPPVVYAPPVCAPQPAPVATYYPGNFVSVGGRNFAVQFGW